MSYLDKTFCASPQCKNDCGRRMTDREREQLTYSQAQYVSYGYFCGQDEKDAGCCGFIEYEASVAT